MLINYESHILKALLVIASVILTSADSSFPSQQVKIRMQDHCTNTRMAWTISTVSPQLC